MMQLSETQQQAISHDKGPAMILAGPGSGKTLVVTSRVKWLIEERAVPPREILVITFSRAAARQMRERFQKMMPGPCPVTFGTFHAVFFQILKVACGYTSADILREDERFRILSALAARENLSCEDRKEMIASLGEEIAAVKNDQIPLEHYYAHSCGEEAFRRICRGYEQTLRDNRKIDFDDMLVQAWKLLREREDLRKLWQQRYRYVLVDEFQDVNRLQYESVRMLTQAENNLFVVGDDDQSIYRFRGARPEIMLGFLKDYPQARVVRLEDNYRCGSRIVDLAGTVVSENRNRYPKHIRSASGKKGSTELRCLKDMETESLYIARLIRQSLEDGREPGQIAILTRTNTGGRYLAERLMEFSIPFVICDTMPILYDHWIAEDLFAYIRLGLGIRDRKDFMAVMNRPVRYLSRECLDTKTVDFERLRMWYEDKPWMVRRIDQLEEELAMLGRMRPYAAVNYIRSGMGYDGFLEEYAAKRRLKKEELLEVADELQEQARAFATFRDWSEHIARCREELAQQQEKAKRGEDMAENAVRISTLHSSKGLEYEEVFLPDLNERVIPHRKALLEAELEEERRLLYVGMTRAKEKLHLFWLRERYGKLQEPSRFLDPLIDE
ncbi:MAG: ATP-dependent helicase [Lachnospiraceae bacterium]|nr:ATP-dependent helicase [Lachnospiraceae bacterium]